MRPILFALILWLGLGLWFEHNRTTRTPAPATVPNVLAQTSKIEPALRTAGQDAEVEFLVHLHAAADLSGAAALPDKAAKGAYVYRQLWQTAQTSQADLQAWLAAQRVPYRSFYIVNALWVRGDAALVEALAQRPDVARLELNSRFRALPQPVPPEALLQRPRTFDGAEPGIVDTNADDLWALGYTGQGIVVGAQDTGYAWDHPALINQYRGWNGSEADHDYNWYDSVLNNNYGFNPCGAQSPEPCDDNSHGTHTLGTAVGFDGGQNRIGMAPAAQWIGCRNMDNGYGSPATYLGCMEFFLAPFPVGGTPAQGQPDLAPDVTINSWTCPGYEGCAWDTLRSAVIAQRSAGIMTVAAAGNEGSRGCSSMRDPIAIYDAAYTVGALRTGTDEIASFSNRGPVTVDGSGRMKPDIAAPGTSTRSSVLNDGYGFKSGTSMAAPHVAGAVALLWSAAPELRGDINATEALLNASAGAIPSESCSSSGSPNNVYGAGRLDVLAALQLLHAPLVRFEISTPVWVDTPLTFTNLSTGTLPLSSTWNFGDGTSPAMVGSSLLPVQHTYTQTGVYTVTLTVSNADGRSMKQEQLTVKSVFRQYLPLILK